MGKKDVEPVVLDRAVGEIHDQVLSASRARDVLGWKPSHGLASGLDETIAWYRAYLGREGRG
jgi:CDP-glucose 4,6-dehydratase